MNILCLLSEEVFEFSDELTSHKAEYLKKELESQFESIFQLCQIVLTQSENASLLTSSLKTLLRFVRWIPIKYIFDTPLLEQITSKFFPADLFRNDSLDCLTEIVNLDVKNRDPAFTVFYRNFIEKLMNILPPGTPLELQYNNLTDDLIAFIRQLALFFSGLFKMHLQCLESEIAIREQLYLGFQYMVMITKVVQDQETFRICVEFWKSHTESVYFKDNQKIPGDITRRSLYGPVHQTVRQIMIDNMAKPEEVVIVEDASGQLIREITKDTSAIELYNSMRQTLIYLTHLDQTATEEILYNKMSQLIKGGSWTWNNLNTLCWSLGSISGTMTVDEEKKFVICMVKDLLTLTEESTGRENKAVCASGIMYVVGQYPRFLRNHWKFFRTVVRKLQDFMHESHPGVKDMACDTIRKIVLKCKEELIAKHLTDGKEEDMFIREMVRELNSTINELEPEQVYSYYGSLGIIIKAINNNTDQKLILMEAMASSSGIWSDTITQCKSILFNNNYYYIVHPNKLQEADTIRLLQHIIRINSAMCENVGPIFSEHLSTIYTDLLNLYTEFETTIQATVKASGKESIEYFIPRLMRSSRRVILALLDNFFNVCGIGMDSITTYVDPLISSVFNGYANCDLIIKEPLVLKVMSTIVKKMKKLIDKYCIEFLQKGIQPTLPLITNNTEDFPTHRSNFYLLLQMLINHNFNAFFVNIPDTQKLIIDCIIWGIKHVERNISEQSLDILNKLLDNVLATPQLSNTFWNNYYMSILLEVFYVLTDRCHKNSFHQQVLVLRSLITIVATNRIPTPLYSNNAVTQTNFHNNVEFITLYLCDLLSKEFSNISREIIVAFIQQLFNNYAVNIDDFRVYVRDFLIQMKEFTSSGQDNSELYIAEKEQNQRKQEEQRIQLQNAVPGLAPQYSTALTIRRDNLEDL